jgi:hypothetical protein
LPELNNELFEFNLAVEALLEPLDPSLDAPTLFLHLLVLEDQGFALFFGLVQVFSHFGFVLTVLRYFLPETALVFLEQGGGFAQLFLFGLQVFVKVQGLIEFFLDLDGGVLHFAEVFYAFSNCFLRMKLIALEDIFGQVSLSDGLIRNYHTGVLVAQLDFLKHLSSQIWLDFGE